MMESCLVTKLLEHLRFSLAKLSTSIGAIKNTILTLQEKFDIPDRFTSVLIGGVLGSLFSFLQFLTAPLAGSLSDCYGRKPALLISMIGIAASYALWVVADNFLLFVLARAVGGISKANVSLATAVMADVSDTSNRTKAMAMVGIAFAIGFIIGPMTGAGFSVWGLNSGAGNWWFWPAMFALTLAIANIGFVAVFLKESLPQDKRAKSIKLSEVWNLVNPVSLFNFKLANNIKKKDLDKLKVLGYVYFLFLFFFSGLEFTLTFLTHLRFNFDAGQQGRMLLFIGLTMGVFQGGLVRRVKAGKEKLIAMIGLAVIIPSFIIIGLAQSTTVLYLGLFLYSQGAAIVVPCLTAMTASYGRADQKGAVMGTLRSLGSLARAIGPLTSSFLFFVFGAELCYGFGACALFFPFFLLRRSTV
uniref:EOG090X09U7 n=1 Tax=Evadne anonyx TaxID=141404 RepID=A0A9N6WUX1_9CRUS|nr:EOG090X09U7 [Evadne anonyx]